MAKRKSLQARLDELEKLRAHGGAQELVQALGPILDSGSYALVAKAAGMIADAGLSDLAPALAAAFDRFLVDPAATDKGCRAKSAIADALRRLWYEDADLFVVGARHRQLEPVWGGSADTACPLRVASISALAEMGYHGTLIVAGDLLADPEAPVRIGAAHALGIAEIAQSEALLRLKALLGDEEPAVTQACFESLLKLNLEASLEFVARFLDSKDAALVEAAAFAIGGTRTAQAFEVLRAWFDREIVWERSRTALVGIALCRHEAAIRFVLEIVEKGSAHQAGDAIRALAVHAPDDKLKGQAFDAVAKRNDPALEDLVEQSF
ncbi:MAG: HEAT repeat domain-containing protein [Gammaproteobacteria bacterium]